MKLKYILYLYWETLGFMFNIRKYMIFYLGINEENIIYFKKIISLLLDKNAWVEESWFLW